MFTVFGCTAPKELLKPFRDVEEEYLGPFISDRRACIPSIGGNSNG